MRIRHSTWSIFLVLTTLLLAACGGPEPEATGDGESSPDSGSAQEQEGESDDLKEVSLRLDWLYGSEHAPYFVALEKGYFEEAGLDVTIREGEGSSVSSKLVGNGDDTFGVVAAGTVLLSVAEGIPIQAVATIFQNTPTAIIFPADKPIKEPADLNGKRLGLLIKSVTYNEWESIADIHSLDRDQINEVAMDRGIVEPMLAGRIDAGIAWLINDGVQLKVKGQETSWLKFSELGLDIPSSTIVANQQMVEEDPETVEAFVSAVLKGWQYTSENPDEAFEIFMENAPDADAEFNEKKLPLVLDLTRTEAGLGHSDPAAWENLKSLYTEGELLKGDVDLDEVYTNEFLSE